MDQINLRGFENLGGLITNMKIKIYNYIFFAISFMLFLSCNETINDSLNENQFT